MSELDPMFEENRLLLERIAENSVLMDAATARIKALEAALRGWNSGGKILADRIEALEAALREIAMLFDSDDGSLEDAIIIASRAIAKRQDK